MCYARPGEVSNVLDWLLAPDQPVVTPTSSALRFKPPKELEAARGRWGLRGAVEKEAEEVREASKEAEAWWEEVAGGKAGKGVGKGGKSEATKRDKLRRGTEGRELERFEGVLQELGVAVRLY